MKSKKTDNAATRSQERMVGGIVIPQRPPPSVVAALRNFVEAVEAYGETGVWPDNGTLRRLADEGRDALGPRNSANDDVLARGESATSITPKPQ